MKSKVLLLNLVAFLHNLQGVSLAERQPQFFEVFRRHVAISQALGASEVAIEGELLLV